jgi:hypothetical protein
MNLIYVFPCVLRLRKAREERERVNEESKHDGEVRNLDENKNISVLS